MSALCNSFILFYLFFWLGCITDERTDKTVFVRVVMNGSPICSLQRVWFFFKASNSRREEKKKQKQERHHLPVITSSYKNLHFVFFFLGVKKIVFFFFFFFFPSSFNYATILLEGWQWQQVRLGCWTSWRVEIFFFDFLNYKKMLQLVALDYPSNLFRHFVAIYLQTFMYDFFLINNKQINDL